MQLPNTANDAPEAPGLPGSVRYVKNGPGGRWWKTALTEQQVHCGWNEVPAEILRAANYEAAAPYVQAAILGNGGDKGAASRDLAALKTLIDRPSQHLWITFEDRRLWWCTVADQVHSNGEPSDKERGHFWLSCATPWSDRSIDGKRHLIMNDLPGVVTTVAGYRATVCMPAATADILRVIHNEEHPAADAARKTRAAYRGALETLIGHLRDKDFELLIDMVLARDGWARTSALGGSGADIDIEVENRSAGEIAFVQIKSQADQSELENYVDRFQRQRDRYSRLIFAVHTPRGQLRAPAGEPVYIWDRSRIADLGVRLGLGEWIEGRV